MIGETLFDLSDVPRDVSPGIVRASFPDIEVAEQRIQDVLERATQPEIDGGIAWYRNANEMCQEWLDRYPNVQSLAHMVGILAALSPIESWTGNIRKALRLLETGKCYGLGYTVRDATAIYKGTHPDVVLFDEKRNNTKVRSFFRNIYDPDDPEHVTVDRHMIGLLLDDPGAGQTKRIAAADHEWVRDRFQSVAEQTGLVPNELQAITWVTWRRMNGITEAENTGQLLLTFPEHNEGTNGHQREKTAQEVFRAHLLNHLVKA